MNEDAACAGPPRLGRVVPILEVLAVCGLFFACVWWIFLLGSRALSRACALAIPVLIVASHVAHRDPGHLGDTIPNGLALSIGSRKAGRNW